MDTTSLETDELTGCLARKAFQACLGQAIETAKATDRPLSMAFLDIDHFMQINNQYGHQAGDRVLQAIAQTMREICGEHMILIRYGGDEFVLLFPDLEREQAFLIMERIRSQITSQGVPNPGKNGDIIPLAISAGVATYPIDGRTEDELMRSADAALYRAKASGRKKIRLAYEDKMIPKTAHYTQTQLERLSNLAEKQAVGEAVLLREALDDLLIKYGVNPIER
jgi:diguanylate cyclase (GGDEF)-like protein